MSSFEFGNRPGIRGAAVVAKVRSFIAALVAS
jgi:hypothetical protein